MTLVLSFGLSQAEHLRCSILLLEHKQAISSLNFFSISDFGPDFSIPILPKDVGAENRI